MQEFISILLKEAAKKEGFLSMLDLLEETNKDVITKHPHLIAASIRFHRLAVEALTVHAQLLTREDAPKMPQSVYASYQNPPRGV